MLAINSQLEKSILKLLSLNFAISCEKSSLNISRFSFIGKLMRSREKEKFERSKTVSGRRIIIALRCTSRRNESKCTLYIVWIKSTLVDLFISAPSSDAHT